MSATSETLRYAMPIMVRWLFSTPWHFLAAHGPAVAATTLLGAVAANVIAKRGRRVE